jgi:hypothetical protein
MPHVTMECIHGNERANYIGVIGGYFSVSCNSLRYSINNIIKYT